MELARLVGGRACSGCGWGHFSLWRWWWVVLVRIEIEEKRCAENTGNGWMPSSLLGRLVGSSVCDAYSTHAALSWWVGTRPSRRHLLRPLGALWVGVGFTALMRWWWWPLSLKGVFLRLDFDSFRRRAMRMTWVGMRSLLRWRVGMDSWTSSLPRWVHKMDSNFLYWFVTNELTNCRWKRYERWLIGSSIAWKRSKRNTQPFFPLPQRTKVISYYVELHGKWTRMQLK